MNFLHSDIFMFRSFTLIRETFVVFSYTDSSRKNLNDRIIKTQEDFFKNMYLSLYCKIRKGYSRFYCERELETEQNLQYIDPTLMAVSVVSFSFSRAAQPETQKPTLLDDGFLYCILSATSLDPNKSGAPRAPSAWCGFPYHISPITTPTDLTSCLDWVI